MSGDAKTQQPMYFNIPDKDTLAQCPRRLATLHIMNVFMLKLTHFKSLTFELFYCVPRFIEYTCRIIISNVSHC